MPASRATPLVTALAAASSLLALGWLGLYEFGWNDYDNEARPAVDALVGGDPGRFLTLAPAYGGSLILRAPFALVPELWGGGSLAVYRMLALPCLAAAGVLAVVLVGRMRARGRSTLACAVALGLLVANPVELRALEIGHPEELLGAALCVGAVLAAGARRWTLAAVLTGLAIANKPWALLALPVVLVLAEGRRLRVLLIAAAVAAAILAPLFAGSDRFADTTRQTASTTGTFQPWQVWWFAGETGRVVRGGDNEVKPGYRAAPAWLAGVTRPLLMVVGVALAVLWWRRRDPGGGWEDGLLALALVLLARCVLDPWNAVYYVIPSLFALTAWEGLTRRDPPVLALLATAATWVTFQELPQHVSPDAQALAYLAWALPLAGLLAHRLYSPGARTAQRAGPWRERAAEPALVQASTPS